MTQPRRSLQPADDPEKSKQQQAAALLADARLAQAASKTSGRRLSATVQEILDAAEKYGDANWVVVWSDKKPRRTVQNGTVQSRVTRKN